MKLEPKLLTDRKRLQEIYDLRVAVWENSEKSEFVNKQLFPNGWKDELDVNGHNFVIINEENKIIANARLNCFENLEEFPFYKNINHLNLPKKLPFGYYSRLVVDKEYQGNGLSNKLDYIIIEYSKIMKLSWIIGLSSNRTEFMIEKLDFENFGIAEVKYNEKSNNHTINVIIKFITNA